MHIELDVATKTGQFIHASRMHILYNINMYWIMWYLAALAYMRDSYTGICMLFLTTVFKAELLPKQLYNLHHLQKKL